MSSPPSEPADRQDVDQSRRTLLSLASSVVMVSGAGAGYGTLAYIAGAFLYPARSRELVWVFVTDLSGMVPGEALAFRAPGGEEVTIARQGSEGTAEDFLALSSVCPHLGCQVRWEQQNNRFFCPCHNGVFDAAGKATGGPPAEAGQSLSRYPLREEDGLLFIQVPAKGLAGGAQAQAGGRQPRQSAGTRIGTGREVC